MTPEHREAEEYAAAAPELERAARVGGRLELPPTPNLAVELRQAANRVSNHCFRKPGDSGLMSIPARPGYDVDLLLVEAAEKLDSYDALVAALEDCANRFEKCCTHSGSDKEFAAHAVENYRLLIKTARGRA